MSEDDPVTIWLNGLRNAESDAAANLWQHFFRQLVEVARRKLRPDSRRVYDEDDAAQSAFHSLCRGVSDGRFDDLNDRDGLWRLLLVITARKIGERHKFDQREKRDIRRLVTESAFGVAAVDGKPAGMEQLESCEPSPEFVVEFSETCDRLHSELGDSSLEDVARLKLQGFTDGEVATELGCSRRTVQRRLEIIRRQWQRLLPGE
jgi:RNA polymerase sigma factor (sigma-70 family)